MDSEKSQLQANEKKIQVFLAKDETPQSKSKYLALLKKEQVKRPLIQTSDILISAFIVTPCILGFWRCSWILMDIYNNIVPHKLCLVVGILVYILSTIIQEYLNEKFQKKSPNLRTKYFKLFLTRLYTYVFGVTSVMYWRGGFMFVDKLLNVQLSPKGIAMKEGSGPVTIAFGIAVILLLLTRSLRNCIAPPFVFVLDRKEFIFRIPTRFRVKRATNAQEKGTKMRGSIAGMPDSPQRTSYNSILFVLDALFSSIVIAPLVVGYWRSIWELMGLYIYPKDEVMSSWISTAIGVVGHLLFMVPQSAFKKYIHPDRCRILYYVLSRLYTMWFAFVCVNGWRGPWQLLNKYTKTDLVTLVTPTLVGIVALAAMRALRNASGAPFTVSLDSVKGYFDIVTMFRVSISERASLYLLDCLFSVLIVGTLVVFVWRGAWALLDIYLFPGNDKLSAWASLIVGYAAVAIAFMLQPIMKWICDRTNGFSRILVADLFLIVSLIGTINVWRGIWNLLNLYFFPDNMELSCWITHWICIIVLILLGCSNSLLVRGVYIDAEEPAGKCVVFPCHYLRLLLQDQEMRKSEQRQANCENNHVITLQSIKAIETNHK